MSIFCLYSPPRANTWKIIARHLPDNTPSREGRARTSLRLSVAGEVTRERKIRRTKLCQRSSRHVSRSGRIERREKKMEKKKPGALTSPSTLGTLNREVSCCSGFPRLMLSPSLRARASQSRARDRSSSPRATSRVGSRGGRLTPTASETGAMACMNQQVEQQRAFSIQY